MTLKPVSVSKSDIDSSFSGIANVLHRMLVSDFLTSKFVVSDVLDTRKTGVGVGVSVGFLTPPVTVSSVGVEIRHRHQDFGCNRMRHRNQHQFFWCHERPTPGFWVSKNPTQTPDSHPCFMVSNVDTNTGNFGLHVQLIFNT